MLYQSSEVFVFLSWLVGKTKNMVEEELTTKMSTDFQQNNIYASTSLLLSITRFGLNHWLSDEIADSNLPVTPVIISAIKLFFTVDVVYCWRKVN